MKKIRKLEQLGIAHLEMLLVIVVIVAVGFVGWKVTQNKQKSSKGSTAQTHSMVRVLPSDLGEILSVDKIKELALAAKSGGVISQIELENDQAGLVYQVLFSDNTLLGFNALSGAQVALEQDDEPEKDEEVLPADFTVQITFAKAIEIAQAKFPDKQVRKVELELEDGIIVFSVRFSDGSRVDVNANDGTVTRQREDNETSQDSNSGSGSSDENEDENQVEIESDDEDNDDDVDDDTEDDTESEDKDDNSGSGNGDSEDSDNSGSNSGSSN